MWTILGSVLAFLVSQPLMAAPKAARSPSSVECRAAAMSAAVDKLWTSTLEGQGSNRKEQISSLVAGFVFSERTKKYSVCVITSNGWDQAFSYKVTLHSPEGDAANCVVDAVEAFTCEVKRGPADRP